MKRASVWRESAVVPLPCHTSGSFSPGVHPFGVLRFEGPQAAERTFDVHRRQSPMMRLRISIATPQALAFSLIFESRNLCRLYTRLSEYLLVADLRGSMM